MRDPLAQALLGRPDKRALDAAGRLTYGTVTQIDPLLVQVGAAVTGQPCAAVGSYSPRVGDYVLVAVNGADRLVISSISHGTVIDLKEATASTWTVAGTFSPITATTGAAPSITANLDTSRRYLAVFDARFQSTVDGDTLRIAFFEGGTTRRGTIGRMSTGQLTVHAEWLFVPASNASVVYDVRGQRETGTGTISVIPGTNTPIHFRIEDRGPA